MLLLATAAALSSIVPNDARRPAGASVQARATVRIISGAVLRLGEGPASGIAPAAQVTFVHADGSLQRAKLIEFE